MDYSRTNEDNYRENDFIIAMIPYGRQSISDADISAVVESLKSDFLSTGPLVDRFESKLSEFVGAPSFTVSSGTAALHCAYFGAGICEGDEVITPPNTFIATQSTLAFLGAKVRFADIDENSGLISLNEVLKQITSRTKAVVVVDYAGQTCEIDEFKSALDKHNILLIEDAAHSLGTTYKGKPVGSLADITTFSFYPTKNITTGEGGAVASKNESALKRSKAFARQGLIRTRDEFVLEEDGPWHQEVQEFGLNYRLTDFQSALGISQLERIDLFKTRRSEIVERYRENLAKLDNVKLIELQPHQDPMWHLFPIRVPKNIRKSLFNFLRENGVGVQVNYFPAHCHPVFIKQGFKPEDFPNSLKFYQEEISLPIHLELEDSVIDEICQLVANFLATTY
jgi:dTDP-4-amino-4,6-dideoxygalactose transaminase